VKNKGVKGEAEKVTTKQMTVGKKEGLKKGRPCDGQPKITG